MGIPDRTVDHSANYETDVYETIGTESAKLNMNDMDVWCAWRLGLAAYSEMRKLGGELPHDPKKPESAESVFMREYLWRNPDDNSLRVSVITRLSNSSNNNQIKNTEEHSYFVKWIDHDWREIKA